MDAYRVHLDASATVPLYRQLAEALRYRISSGALQPGTRLPPLRDGAELWGVNLHTVRRAYLELQSAELVEVQRPLGTFVAPGRRTDAPTQAQAFVRETVEAARTRFGWSALDLARVIEECHAPRSPPVTHVVECSRTLSGALADQVRARWGGDVRPVHLEALAGVGPGRVVGTYFHFNEIRATLAHRIQDLRFVSIAPVASELRRAVRDMRAGGATAFVLCERDGLMAQSVAADVAAILEDAAMEMRVEITSEPGGLLRRGAPVLFSPGSWDHLSDEQRRHPGAFLLRYRISDGELGALEPR